MDAIETRRYRLVRYLRARWRYVWIVTRGFKTEVFFFTFIIFLAGWLIHRLHPSHPDIVKAVHAALALLAVQPELDFPEPAKDEGMTYSIRVVQAIWFLLPVMGVTVVAETLIRLGVLVMNKETGREEWQVAVAGTMKDHTVVIGYGRIGYRVVGQLATRDPHIVVVENTPKEEFSSVLEKYEIPLIIGDARRDEVLEKANVRTARTILALTNDDLVNIEVALNARELNPSIKVVLRMFDEHLAARIERAFDFQAVFSTTALAAPSFAAAVWNQKIVTSVAVGDAHLHLARFEVVQGSPLVGLTIALVEARHAVNILLHQREGQKDLLPSAGNVIGPHDALWLVGGIEAIDAFDKLAGGMRPRGRSRRLAEVTDDDARAVLSRQLEAHYDQMGDALERGEKYESRAKARALALLDARAGHSVLEVGVGTGGLLWRVAQRVEGGGRVIGIDVAESLLRRARARVESPKGTNGVTLVRGTAVRIPLRDESVDRVLTTYVLDLLEEEDVLAALVEMRRVVRPGGLVVCAGLTSRGASLAGQVMASVLSTTRRFRPLWTGGCRPLDLEPLARRAGLRVVAREVVEQKGRASEIVCCAR